MKYSAVLPRARTKDLIVRELGDETLVYDIERDEAHCLNHVAGFVWRQFDGKTIAQQAAQRLQRKFGVSVDSDLVWLAINQLQRFHLLAESLKSPSVSRRQVMLKYAPAALALPVIMSISAPTAAQTQSNCATLGQPCSANRPCCQGQGTCFGSPPTCRNATF